MFSSASQGHDWVFQKICRTTIFVELFAWNFWQIVLDLSAPTTGSGEFMGADGSLSFLFMIKLMVCEQCLKGCDHAHSWCVNFARCGRMVTFKVSLWIFCCNLIDVLVIRLWGPQCKSKLQVHTPDSSRYWIAASYEERQSQGMEPENIDKVLCSALRCYWMLFSESQYLPYPSFFNCLR